MRKTLVTLASALLLMAVWGCNKAEQSENDSNTTTEGNEVSANVDAAPARSVQHVQATTPKDAVEQFLTALRSGDDKTAEGLLTTKAREETARNNMVVQPPGTPNATYEVGRVEHPDGQPDAAYVSCVWNEKYTSGEVDSYEVVWVLRRETPDWRVAGMFTQLDDESEPVLLNFENPVEMIATLQRAEQEAESGSTTGQTDTSTPPLTAQGPAKPEIR